MQNIEIHTRPCFCCPICQSRGHLLHAGLTDEVFQAPGTWNIRKCDNLNCGTLWLDPAPVEDDLPKLYTGYYTHQTPFRSASSHWLQLLFERVAASYLHSRFGYETPYYSRIDKVLSIAVHLHPVWKNILEASVFHLDAKPGGHLLEIGCGSGAALQLMQNRGWHAIGLDFDEGAVEHAKSKGLDVRLGQLSAQTFSEESFDAVVMSHVIEHVPSPDKLLVECLKILKKEGILVALTPNVNSPGHKHYGRNWRAFETPRHLQIFTPKSLGNLADFVGFQIVDVFTTMNGFLYLDPASKQLAAGEKHIMGGPITKSRRVSSHIKAFCLGWLCKFFSIYEGEEIVLVGRK